MNVTILSKLLLLGTHKRNDKIGIFTYFNFKTK